MSHRFVKSYQNKLDGIESNATADQTGAEIKSLYEAEPDTNAFTDALLSKLNNIEALADVTDATNVDAAGAVMNSDTSTASMSFVIDEDNMSSNSATKVPTQQSVKAYVDNALTSSLDYKGSYNAATNTPDLDTSPSGVNKGDVYTVTAAGNFFSTAVEVGDVIIAEIDNASVEADWTIVNKNIDAATTTTPGIVELATDGETNANVVVQGNDNRLALASSAMQDLVDDTTPQLGGMLDVNGQSLGDGTRKLLSFVEDGSSVNNIEIENQATGSGPIIRATGTDTNIDLVLETKGTGQVKSIANLNLTGNIIVTGTVDGRDVSTDGSKLDGIEANADVTDATNVDAAGAVMNSDSSTSAMSFVIDEDTMSSNSDTKVPTQQSVKAYVDNNTSIMSVVSKTNADSPYSASVNEFIKCNATSGAIIVNLPAASGNSGRRIYVKKTDSSGNSVTLDANASETIDGALTEVIVTQWATVLLVCDGSNWMIG